MMMTLLYKQQMESKSSLTIQALLWSLYGLIIAILLSLHSSTLFIIPLVFIITSTVFIYKVIKKKNYRLIFMPFISIVSGMIFLTPYWIGEFGRSFGNTKAILKTLVTSSSQSDSSFVIKLLTRLYNLFFNYFKLGQQAYFWNASWFYLVISIIFLSIVTYIGLAKFRGNRHIWLLWISTWLIFFAAAANLDANKAFFFYKSLILFAPIVFTVSSLAYQDYSPDKKTILNIFLGLIIVVSCFNNFYYDYRFMMSKYGETSLVSTGDVTQILNQIPANSTICDPRIKRKRKNHNQYNYIDTYVTRKGLKTTAICQAGDYVIHPKRIMLIEGNFLNDTTYTTPYFFKYKLPASVNLFPTFKIADNEMIERPSELFYETKTAYVYRLNG